MASAMSCLLCSLLNLLPAQAKDEQPPGHLREHGCSMQFLQIALQLGASSGPVLVAFRSKIGRRGYSSAHGFCVRARKMSEQAGHKASQGIIGLAGSMPWGASAGGHSGLHVDGGSAIGFGVGR